VSVDSPNGQFTVDGHVDQRTRPTTLALNVTAQRFAFQKWAGTLAGLKNIAVEADFETTLAGPLAALATDLDLRSASGNVRGSFVLDTQSPGWKAKGPLTVARLDLAGWLNRPDRPSDISGDVTVDLTDVGIKTGGHFPVGAFTFDGSHAGFIGYEADDVKARGNITATEVRIAETTATAYGANVRLASSTIGVDGPYRFHFVGVADGVDLRQVPSTVPVPHVESTLTFAFDTTGQFTSPYIKGSARFRESVFLGATLGEGATGTIDTSTTPFHYGGEGNIANVDLNHFGRALEIAWLSEPRYNGLVRGRFHVDGRGADTATMELTGGGRLARADIFGGQLRQADVEIDIRNGSLTGSYDGFLYTIDPSIALGDERYAASLTGAGRGQISVRDVLIRTAALDDYSIDASLDLEPCRVGAIPLDKATMTAALHNGTLQVSSLDAVGPDVEMSATGRLEFDGQRSSQVAYDVTRGDLRLLKALSGPDLAGVIVTKGEMTGPVDRLRLIGTGTGQRLEASGVRAAMAEVQYDVTLPPDDPRQSSGSVSGRLAGIQVSGRTIQELSGSVAYDAGRVKADLNAVAESPFAATDTAPPPVDAAGRPVVTTPKLTTEPIRMALGGSGNLDLDAKRLALDSLLLTIQQSSWRLDPSDAARIAWSERGMEVRGLALVDAGAGNGSQRVRADGTWYPEGGGALSVTGTHVSLDPLTSRASGAPARFAGTADFTAMLGGSRARPTLSGEISIADGRIWRVAYESIKGHVDFADGAMKVDFRLDQRPGVWLTAVGRVPLSALQEGEGAEPLDVAVASSQVDLGILEGVTNVVSDIHGALTLNVRVLGTTRDPHFDGRVDISDAAFLVASSGARYKNGRVAVGLTTERVTVDTFHIEDGGGHPLDLTGSLGTHELRVSDLTIDIVGRSFEVLNNEYGRLDIDVAVELRGQFESPRLGGRITVASGTLNVDAILDRTMLQSYSTQPLPGPEQPDAIRALNPWDRLTIDTLELHVPGTLRMEGDNIQLSAGTPLGLGNINLRAIGDLYLYKDPGQLLYVNGSLDQVTGTFAFQGKRFDLDPVSSINFRGDLNPELYVTVSRDISGVEARVTIAGDLNQPELRLASTPPLEPSDILSLIVFNTSTNQLSALEQQQLAIRAGTLAAGFVAAPIMAAFERSLGLDTLEIEPGADLRGGPRVTIGNEIAPGLVARFSRQFGESEYDEAMIEYYLSRILRIRATFSDAGVARSPFRRVERAGIDLLLFFSF
jgi:autotransporter translocation and assembly factor TamB